MNKSSILLTVGSACYCWKRMNKSSILLTVGSACYCWQSMNKSSILLTVGSACYCWKRMNKSSILLTVGSACYCWKRMNKSSILLTVGSACYCWKSMNKSSILLTVGSACYCWKSMNKSSILLTVGSALVPSCDNDVILERGWMPCRSTTYIQKPTVQEKWQVCLPVWIGVDRRLTVSCQEAAGVLSPGKAKSHRKPTCTNITSSVCKVEACMARNHQSVK